MQGKMPRNKIPAKKKIKKKIHAEGRSNCDFKICQMKLLWRDVIYLLGCSHPKNFAVLSSFAIYAFNMTTVYRSNLVIFRYNLAA